MANMDVLYHKPMSAECQNTDKYTECSAGCNLKPFIGVLCADGSTENLCEKANLIQAAGSLYSL